jgi:hypothetical protein
MDKESRDTGTGTALWGATQEQIKRVIDEIDDGNEGDVETIPPANSAPDLSLQDMCDEIHTTVENELQKMKESLTADTGDVDAYIRLNQARLAFQHWVDDIVVQNENPLATVKQDKRAEESWTYVARLRAHLVETQRILEDFE